MSLFNTVHGICRSRDNDEEAAAAAAKVAKTDAIFPIEQDYMYCESINCTCREGKERESGDNKDNRGREEIQTKRKGEEVTRGGGGSEC